MMEAKQLSSREITESYLERIEAVDGSLRSILEINPDALSIADALDGERREGRVRGKTNRRKRPSGLRYVRQSGARVA